MADSKLSLEVRGRIEVACLAAFFSKILKPEDLDQMVGPRWQYVTVIGEGTNPKTSHIELVMFFERLLRGNLLQGPFGFIPNRTFHLAHAIAIDTVRRTFDMDKPWTVRRKVLSWAKEFGFDRNDALATAHELLRDMFEQELRPISEEEK